VPAVKIAREASRGRAKIVGSLGPTGRFIVPLGDLEFEEAYRAFYEQSKALADAGADCLIFETCIDIQEMRAGLLAAKDATKLPIICQLSYSEDGRSVTGTDPQTAAITLEALGADIIGVNCSLGPQEPVPIVKTPTWQIPLLTLAFAAIWTLLYFVLTKTNSTVPVLDSMANALSIVAMWMLARKYIEQWLVWFVVDAILCGLYIYKGVPFHGILYGFYTIVAILGYQKWQRMLKP